MEHMEDCNALVIRIFKLFFFWLEKLMFSRHLIWIIFCNYTMTVIYLSKNSICLKTTAQKGYGAIFTCASWIHMDRIISSETIMNLLTLTVKIVVFMIPMKTSSFGILLNKVINNYLKSCYNSIMSVDTQYDLKWFGNRDT